MVASAVQGNSYSVPVGLNISGIYAGVPAGAQVSGIPLMSPDELLAYLETRLTALNGRIRDKMGVGEKNVDMLNKLSKACNELASTKTQGKDQWAQTAKDIEELLATYGDELPPGMKGDLETALGGLQHGVQTFDVVSAHFGTDDKAREFMLGPGADANAVDRITGNIKAEIDKLNTVDQQNLTELQSLMSQYSQATSLVSNMLASFNESLKGVIGNLRS